MSRSAFGETVNFGGGAGGGATPSSMITGLSSRQVLFGSPSGGIAQSTVFQVDSTQGFVGIGTSAPRGPLDVRRFANVVSTADGDQAQFGLVNIQGATTNAWTFVLTTANQFFLDDRVAVRLWGDAVGIGIGTTAPSGPFQVNSDTTAVLTVTTSNRVGIGTTSPLVALHTVRSASSASGVWTESYSVSTVSAPNFGMLRSAGTQVNPAAIGAETDLGRVDFHGRFSTLNGGFVDYSLGARIRARAAEAFAAGAAGTDLIFESVTTGTTALLEGMRLKNGQVGIGTTAPSGSIDVQGTSNAEVARFSGRSSDGTTLGPALVVKSTGTTQTVAFFSSVGSTQAPGYATTGTTSRTFPTTISPAAVYSSLVGAQLNQIQGVLKSLILDLSAGGGFGLLGSTV